MATTVQSVERAFTILETFDEHHPTRSAADIAELAGLARPTTYRMLQTLQALGYVRSHGGRFEVTPRVLRLGAGYLAPDLAERAQPVLDELSATVGEHVAIGTLDGDEVIAVAVANSAQSRFLSVAVQVGQRLPASHTALGRVLLAHRPGPVSADAGSDSGPDAAAAEAIRRDGYVVVDGLLEPGMRTMGVPVRDHGGDVIAALSIAVNASRIGLDDLCDRCLPELRAAAGRLATRL
ncbi:MAG: helix-turn-helix domain-containing protein [Actinomycetota bacterium]|nr:helix-turn-helix domain-containing protein [Actinomycetota bacterium]